MKWLTLGVKMLAHPSLLPIAVATFVTMAGPGGVAEFGRTITPGPIVAAAPESPRIPVSEHPAALLVRVVHEPGPAPVAPVVEAETPQPTRTEEVASEAVNLSANDQASADNQHDPQISPAAEVNQQPPAIGGPLVGPDTPQHAADDRADNGGGGGAGDAGNDGDQPADEDDGSVTPPPNNGGAGEEPSGGNGGDTTGDSGDTGEDASDVPGNGQDKHPVEPGHDKNNDGVDDRCQQNGGDDEGIADNGCDVSSDGQDNHPVEPGHDRNKDGVDDRSQQGGGDDQGTVGDECNIPGNGNDNHP